MSRNAARHNDRIPEAIDVGATNNCPECAARRRRARRFIRISFGLVALLAALISAGIPIYVNPRTDPLRKADAVFILGGYGDRRHYAISLHQQGWAPNTVMSNPSAPPGFTTEATWTNRWCHSPTWGMAGMPNPEPWPTSTKFCPVPDPPTTSGEARALEELAAQYGWKTVIVATSRPHIARARAIFEKCFSGSVIMTAIPGNLTLGQWAFEYIYQTFGFMKALLARDC